MAVDRPIPEAPPVTKGPKAVKLTHLALRDIFRDTFSLTTSVTVATPLRRSTRPLRYYVTGPQRTRSPPLPAGRPDAWHRAHRVQRCRSANAIAAHHPPGLARRGEGDRGDAPLANSASLVARPAVTCLRVDAGVSCLLETDLSNSLGATQSWTRAARTAAPITIFAVGGRDLGNWGGSTALITQITVSVSDLGNWGGSIERADPGGVMQTRVNRAEPHAFSTRSR